MTRIIYLFTLLCSTTLLTAQSIYGTVTDEQGDRLPFVNIYIKGTSIGTTTNAEGFYKLKIGQGQKEIAFQYVGYETLFKTIQLASEDQALDVVIKTQSVSLQTIEVKAEEEDPAYAIIRKARDKRSEYEKEFNDFYCEAYAKQVIKVVDKPESFFGQETGDMEGIFDTLMNEGVLYLSESVSKLNYDTEKGFHEEIISSKVSGEPLGFTWNNAQSMSVNVYQKYFNYGRKIISPIAPSCMQYYRYKLIGAFYDDANRLVNKIEVFQRRTEDPAFHGYIYILEDTWRVHGTELKLSSGAHHVPFIDSMSIRQSLLAMEGDRWVPISLTIHFPANAFGFKLEGDMMATFNQYDLNPDFSSIESMGKERLVVNENSNEKGEEYWETIRPVPLTETEQRDYVRKDSLYEIHNSPEYLDSIDKAANKYSFMNLIFGYRNTNRSKNQEWSIGSPITSLPFNTVQGFNPNIAFNYKKTFDKQKGNYLSIDPNISYGFSDEKLRWRLGANYHFDNINYKNLRLSLGNQIVQVDEQQPISPILNTISTLMAKENYARWYEKRYASLSYRQYFWKDFYGTIGFEHAQRKAVVNTTDYAFVKNDDKSYSSNRIIHNGIIQNMNAATLNRLDLSVRYQPGRKYITRPNERFYTGSKWPIFTLSYQKAIAFKDGDTKFDHLNLKIRDNWSFGLLGRTKAEAEFGFFASTSNMGFMDYKHFNGNQFWLLGKSSYNGFLMMPYYDFSSNNDYAMLKVEHNFEGWILDKIPLIKKLRFKTVAGARFLYTPDNDLYTEWNVGIDNIGLGMFRNFRIDFGTAIMPSGDVNSRVMLGIKL